MYVCICGWSLDFYLDNCCTTFAMTSFLIQVHLTLMLASLFVGSVGVAMVFIAHAREDNPRGLITLGSGNVSALKRL